MAEDRQLARYDRVQERRRTVALARHFREAKRLSIAQIAERLGRSPGTAKAYFYDPVRHSPPISADGPVVEPGTRSVYPATIADSGGMRDGVHAVAE